MADGPKSTQQTPDCKIKRVNPAVRSVSTLRSTKDLPVGGPVNPQSAVGAPSARSGTSRWSAERFTERLQSRLSEVV